jgi:hypothetical protein
MEQASTSIGVQYTAALPTEKYSRAHLRPIAPGLYVDDTGGWYICVSEFLAAQRLPNAPAVREVLLEEISLCFPEITCIEFSD